MNSYLPTKKELYVSVAAAIFGVAILILSLFVTLDSLSTLNKESMEIGAAALGVDKTFLIKKELADWRREIDLLDSFFVNPGGEVVFIEKLEAAAKSSGVKIEISSIAVGKKEVSSDIAESLEMKIRFEGEWRAVANFLRSLENMAYAVTLGGVEVNLIGGPLWKGEVDVSVLKIKST